MVLLRDPAERAWSHHRHMVRLGYETLDLRREALAAEEDRCAPDLAALAADPDHDPKALLRYSYAARGHYAGQLARWYARYPRDQVLVLPSTRLFERPAAAYAEVLSFLGLAPWSPPAFRNASAVPGAPDPAPIDSNARRRLDTAFAADVPDPLVGLTDGRQPPGHERWGGQLWRSFVPVCGTDERQLRRQRPAGWPVAGRHPWARRLMAPVSCLARGAGRRPLRSSGPALAFGRTGKRHKRTPVAGATAG